MEKMPLALQLGERVHAFELGAKDQMLIDAARTAIIDTVAVTVLGANAPCTRIARDTLAPLAGGPCSVLGDAVSASVLDATFINGIASHAYDFDDFTQEFGGHPSVPIVPGLLALAERCGASGLSVLEAYIAGVELETRLAQAVHFEHYEKGWHPTSTLGVFGAAAAASKLMSLTPQHTATALAIAASMASGVKANFGTMTKPLHIGHAARDGVHCALLAEAGFDAQLHALEHAQGFLNLYNGQDNFRIERMLQPWFSPAVVIEPGISLKQFACCGSTHPAIFMALRLRDEGLSLDDVTNVWVGTHPRRLPHTFNPDPKNGLEAKFSMQYCVARALVSGAPRRLHFEDDAIDEPQVRQLMAKMTVVAHPQMQQADAPSFGAEVRVDTRQGSYCERVDHMPGRGPKNPMSEHELYQKFSDCVDNVLNDANRDGLWRALLNLAYVSDVREVMMWSRPQLPADEQRLRRASSTG